MTEQARTGERDYTKLLEDARKRFGLSNKETEKSEAEETKPEVQNKKYWETQKKNAETELAALTTIEAAGAKGQALRNKIAGFDKKLGLYSVSSSSKSGNNAQENADMLVNEAAQRRKQEEEYARQLADQQEDFEFEIRQARIDAMKEGIEKEMAQNELNYDRLKAQNQRRERDMLDALADEQIRLEEDANPYLFKRKNKDGKWEEDPGKREERYREIRASITIDELDPTQQKQLEEFGRVAAEAYKDANKKSIDSMLADFMTYEQQRTKIAEEYAKKRADLYEKNEDGSVKTDADGNMVMRKGVTQGNIEELNRQEDEALKAIDEQFASREETYQAWCNSIANLTLTQLNELLTKAQKELDDLETQNSAKPGSVDAKKLATARAKVNTMQAKVEQAEAQEVVSPGKRTIKEWEDLYKTLNEVRDAFEEIGDAFGGVVGDIMSDCGKIATSSLSMINGIMTLANWSVTATQMTAQGASKAIQTVEKASVILTVISAALQIAMQIASLVDLDQKHEKRIEEIQDSVDNLQYSYDQLGREIDKTFGKDASALIDQQTQMLENQKKLIQMQIAEEEAKKNSDDDRIKEWRNQLKELNNDIEDSKAAALDAIFGEDINSAIERLADGLTDAWGECKEGAQSARDAVRTMMQQMVSASIKAAIQSSGQMERIRLKLKEFYEDNVLQPWEQQQIYDMAEQLQKELDAQYGWSKSLFETNDEEERSAAQKGIASASQDSVDELNGRATAIQGHTFSISENTKLLLSTAQAILYSVMNIESETDGFGGRLERIEDNIKTMTNTLDDIAARGIRMKN